MRGEALVCKEEPSKNTEVELFDKKLCENPVDEWWWLAMLETQTERIFTETFECNVRQAIMPPYKEPFSELARMAVYGCPLFM